MAYPIGEDIRKRTRNSKHILQSDGSYLAIITAGDQHFEDYAGNLHNIETALVDEAEFDIEDDGARPVCKHARSTFRDKAAQVRADKKGGKHPNRSMTDWHSLRTPHHSRLPKNIKKGYSIAYGEDTLSFIPAKASPSQGQIKPDAPDTVEYQDVWPLVDVQLQVTAKGIKETLILKKPGAQSQFSFEVRGPLADDLTAGSIRIQKPWLKDFSGTIQEVSAVVRRDGQKTYLDMEADLSGLIYPVEIDPTATYYPSGDYRIYFIGSDMDYQLVHDSASGTHFTSTDTSMPVGQSYINGTMTWIIYRNVHAFDTSGIPDDAIIASATLKLYGDTDTSATDFDVTICPYNGTQPPAGINDYNDFGTTNYGSLNTASFVGNAYNNISLNASGIGVIDKTGITYLGLRSSRDISATAPTENEYVHFKAADYTGTDKDPILEVVYNEPPAAPTVTSPNGGETIDTTHTITWTAATDSDTAQGSLQYQIQLSTNNGSDWADVLALSTAGATSYEYNFTGESESPTCLIRIRAYDGALYGPWDTSNGVFTIDHNVAPSQPTSLSPSGGTPQDRAQTIRLSWQHNDANNDPQSKYDLHWSSDGGSTWTEINGQVSVNQYHDISGGTFPHGNIVFKVRTYDQADLASPWSDQATFLAGDKPSAPTITDPADSGVVEVARPTVQWSSSGQTGYECEALDSLGATAWDSGEVTSTNKAVVVGNDLINGDAYDIRVRIKNSDGLWSDWDTNAITVSYTPPAVPTLTVTAQTGYISVSIGNPTPEGTEPAVTSNDLYRRVSGELVWTRIVTGLADDGAYDDYAVASGVTYEYKARAFGDNGTVTDSIAYSGSMTLTGVWLHDVTDPAGTVHNFQLDGQGRQATWQAEVALMQFAGRALPVMEFGEGESGKISVVLQMLKTGNDLAILDALVRRKATLCYRDGRNRRAFGVIQSYSVKDERVWGYTVQIDHIETSHDEEV